jgi:Tol biopolymer transport system component
MCKLKVLPILSLFFLAGCFPIELDVKDGKLLIAREEGYFVFDPAGGKAKKICGAEDGKPVFARLSPDGKEVLTVFKSTKDFGDFRFVIRPIDGGKGRDVFKGPNCAYVRYSPDGKTLAIVRMSDKEDPELKNQVPELYLVPAKGGESKMLARKVGQYLRWFADSKRLLIFELQKKVDNNYLGSLAVMDVASGKTTPLASLVVSQTFHFDLSPDNKKALFTALRADKAGVDLGKGKEYAMKLFELDIAKGTVRKTDKEATYAIYSPDGKQVLLGTPPQGFSFDSLKLEVADADVTKSTVIAPNAAMPMTLGGGGTIFPGWVDDKTVFYFVSKAVYGTEGKSLNLTTVGIDGKGRKNLQPAIDTEVLKDEK